MIRSRRQWRLHAWSGGLLMAGIVLVGNHLAREHVRREGHLVLVEEALSPLSPTSGGGAGLLLPVVLHLGTLVAVAIV